MLYAIIIAFFAGIAFYIYEYINESAIWAFSSVNRHLSDGSMSGGKILDKNDEILAQTLGGKRVYHHDADVRRAMLHIVGDGSALIPTSIQSRYSTELFGYNFVTGFGAPEYFITNQDIKLTVDSKICATVAKSFKDKKGTALAYNYRTGELICMVSSPGYDVCDRPDWSRYNSGEYEGVYINRALSSAYTPGSIFKVFTTIAGLDYIPDIQSRNFNCEKVKIINGEKVTCMQKHGKLSLMNALAKSCDIAFCDIATELGKAKMTDKLETLGFNMPQYFEGIQLALSRYDISDASAADLGWSGIGQYTDLVNPMHVLKIMGALANGGVSVEPFMVRLISTNGSGIAEKTSRFSSSSLISKSTADAVKEMMRFTMKNHYKDSVFGNIPMCAKTGTAEVGGDSLPHGWMVGFSYDDNFPVAFVVIVEHSDFGIKSAGPIAGLMIKEIHSAMNR